MREALSVVAGIVAFLVVVMLVMTLVALRTDIAPGGTLCTSTSLSNGGASGQEEISWGIPPVRRCVADGERSGGPGFVAYLIAGALGLAAAGAAASQLDRVLRRGGVPPAVEP